MTPLPLLSRSLNLRIRMTFVYKRPTPKTIEKPMRKPTTMRAWVKCKLWSSLAVAEDLSLSCELKSEKQNLYK